MNGLLRFGESLFPFFLDFVYQATALMLVIFAISFVLGRRRAQARYWLWVYCLVGVLLLPVISFVVRDHRVALLPAKEGRAVSDLASRSSEPPPNIVDRPVVTKSAQEASSSETVPLIEPSPTLSAEEETLTGSEVVGADDYDPGPDVTTAENVGTEAPAETSVATTQESGEERGRKSGSPFPWQGAISLAWLAGCGIFLLRLVFAAISVARICRSSSRISDSALSGLFERAKKAAGVRSGVRLRLCKRLVSPVSVGIFRPTVFLPEALAQDLSPEQLYPILLHELAHIRSGDYAVNVLERIVKSLLFFHPIVWFMSRELHALREEVCDDRVLDCYSDSVLYARILTDLAGRNVRRTSGFLASLCFFNHRALIERRVERILATAKRPRRRFQLRTAITLLTISFAVVGCLSLLSFSARGVETKEGVSSLRVQVSPAPGGGSSEELPEGVVFEGLYKHRSRGRDYGTSKLWIKGDKNEAIIAITELRSTTYTASGDKEHRLTEYKITSRDREGFEWILTVEKGKAISRRKSPSKEDEVKEIPVPEGHLFDPNSRPDPYCVANILLRSFDLKERESSEVNAHDWDNSGEGMATYTFKIENRGKEEVMVPAGTFKANHVVLTQLTTGNTWYKKRAGHVTDFWVLDNDVIVRILRHREPYELLLADYKSLTPLPGLKERAEAAAAPVSYVTTPIRTFRSGTSMNSVAFSPDGKRVLAGGAGGTLKLWDAETGEEIRSFSGHRGKVASVAFSPDGKQIVAGSWGGTAKLWDAATGEEIRAFDHPPGIEQVVFSPDGTKVLTAGHDGTAKIWDASTGEEIRTFSGHKRDLCWATFSPDGALVLTGSGDGTAKIWDADAGREIRTFSAHPSGVQTTVFSPDGKKVLTGGEDATAKLWDAETGKLIRTFRGNRWVVWAAAYSPDGKTVLTSGSFEGTARLWDASTGELIRTFTGHRGPVDQVTYSPDGKKVATASHDGTVRLWDVGPIGVTVPAKEVAAAPAAEVKQEAEVLINLEPYLNAPMKAFHDKPGNDLTITPGGHRLAGIYFQVAKGIIWIGGNREENKDMPLKVEGIKIGLKLRKLHFLHSTCWTAPEGTRIGSYIVHYQDGSTAEIPLVYGANIRNWWIHGEPRPDISQGKVAWRGINPHAWGLTRLRVQLYTWAWENPHPDKLVTTIDFTSSNTDCSPWVVAMTAETEAAAPAAEVRVPTEVIIDITRDGKFLLNQAERPIKEIRDMLQKVAKENLDIHIIVRCDPETPHETVVNVLDACEEANISKVSFAVLKQGEEEKPAPSPAVPAKGKEEGYVPSATTPEGLYREGSRLRSQGRADEALKAWRTLTEKFPESNRAGCAAVYMGQLQLSMKDHKGAEKSFKLAAEKFGDHRYANGVEVGGYAYFYLTHVYCETEQYKKAGESLKALVEKYPYARGHRMGDALMSLRAKRWFYDKLKAKKIDLKFLDNLIAEQKDPKNFDKMNSRQLYLVAHNLMRDDKDNPTAIKAFLKGVQKFPEESFTPYGAVFALQLQIEEKDHEGAKQTAKLMIEKFPNAKVGKGGPVAAIGYYGLGAAHFEAKEYKKAAETFQKVAEQFPTAADMDGVQLKSLIAERYISALKEKGIKVKGFSN